MDVGCDRSLYAVEFAKRGLNVDLYDLSSGMLQYTAERISELGVTRPVTYQGNWQTEKVENMQNKYDLIFSALNPAVTNKMAIDKMNQCSRNWCMYLYSAGNLNEPQTEQLDYAILDTTIPNSGFNEVIFPLIYLYCNGYQPQLSYTSSQWESRMGVEEKIAELKKRYENHIVLQKIHKEMIGNFVEDKAENGQFVSRILWEMGILLWQIQPEK